MNNQNLITKPATLILLEGWGLSPFWANNAINYAEPANFNFYWQNYPHLTLKTLNRKHSTTGFCMLSLSSGCLYKPHSKYFKGEKVFFHSKPNLSKIISGNGLKQLKITEKIAVKNISEYFNGFKDSEYDGEKRVLIGNENIDVGKKPEMNSNDFPEYLFKELESENYDFILIVFPNIDLLKNAKIELVSKAVKAIDDTLGKIVDIILDKNGQIFISSSCGGAEHIGRSEIMEKIDFYDYVPFIHIKNNNSKSTVVNFTREVISQIIDPKASIDSIAPTILESLSIGRNEQMTGKSLLNQI